MRRRGKKERSLFVCSDCGRSEAQWTGRCPACGGWDTMKEAARDKPSRGTGAVSVSMIETADSPRFASGIAELDRVMGGGLVPGSMTLLGGEPGVGKSTILLQLANATAARGEMVLYASGEESPRQIKLRADRLSCVDENIYILGETDVQAVCAETHRLSPRLLVVDSIQTMVDNEQEGVAGSPRQIRACAQKLLALAKDESIATIIVGHVTKEGDLAGPKLLEHMVDTVLSFEGDPQNVYRFLRAVKNRFGAVSELGVFIMREDGLRGVDNPSSLFIHRESLLHSGACLAPVVVGSRSYVVEVQALVTENNFTFGRRIAQGYDLTRLNLVLSVLEKRLGIPLGRFDVCLNVTGGLQVREPALDLAVAVSVLSSYRDTVVPAESAWSGEIGLSGEVRPVHHLDKRIEEARRVGCSSFYAPVPGSRTGGRIKVVDVADLSRVSDIVNCRGV